MEHVTNSSLDRVYVGRRPDILLLRALQGPLVLMEELHRQRPQPFVEVRPPGHSPEEHYRGFGYYRSQTGRPWSPETGRPPCAWIRAQWRCSIGWSAVWWQRPETSQPGRRRWNDLINYFDMVRRYNHSRNVVCKKQTASYRSGPGVLPFGASCSAGASEAYVLPGCGSNWEIGPNVLQHCASFEAPAGNPSGL